MANALIEEAEKMYVESLMTRRDVAAATGISLSRISSMSAGSEWPAKRNAWRAAHGLPAVPNRGAKPVDWTRVRAEFLLGQKSIAALASENDIGQSTLRRRIAKERWREIGAAVDAVTDAADADPCAVNDPVGVRYITGNEQLMTLANDNGIKYNTLRARAIRGHWRERRESFRKRQAAELEKVHIQAASAMAQKLAAVNAKVLDKVDSTLDLEDLRSQELEQLSKTLLNVEETDHRLGRRMRPAEQAMIDIARKRAENEAVKNTPGPAPEIKWSDECWSCAQ